MSFRFLKTFLWVANLVMLGCGGQTASTDLKVIRAIDEQSTAEIEIKGFDIINDKKVFLVSAGKNLHPVSNCDDVNELNSILDRSNGDKPDSVSYDALIAGAIEEEVYLPRSELSCKGDFLPRKFLSNAEEESNSPEVPVYYSQDAYYVDTGAKGEYYLIDPKTSSCVYKFASTLFGFERRLDSLEFGMPPDLAKSITLNCANNDRTHYRLMTFTAARGGGAKFPFKTIVFLSFQNTSADGSKADVTIPFHRIDGQLIDKSSPIFISFIEELKLKYRVNEVAETSQPGVILKLYGKLLYDFCLNDCGDSFAPTIETLAKGQPSKLVAPTPVPSLSSKPDLSQNGLEVSELIADPVNQIRFLGCENQLLKSLGLKSSKNDWFPSLRSQVLGRSPSKSDIFECPAKAQPLVCEKTLARSKYSWDELRALLNDKNGCPSGSNLLRFKVDSNLIIEASGPITLNRDTVTSEVVFEPLVPTDRKTITYRFVCLKKSDCVPSGLNSEIRAFAIESSRTLTFSNIDLKAEIDSKNFLSDSESSSLRFTAAEASFGSQLSLNNSSLLLSDYNGRNLWHNGVRIISQSLDLNLLPIANVRKSSFTCVSCSIQSDGVAIDLRNSIALMTSLKESTFTIKSKEWAVKSNGGSEVILSGGVVEGAKLFSFSDEAKGYVNGTKLVFSGDTLKGPVNAFSFMTRSFGGPGFTLELHKSSIHGLPLEQVDNFKMVDFSSSDGSSSMNLGVLTFYRNASDNTETVLSPDQIEYFLRCKGEGQLLYRFKNYCI